MLHSRHLRYWASADLPIIQCWVAGVAVAGKRTPKPTCNMKPQKPQMCQQKREIRWNKNIIFQSQLKVCFLSNCPSSCPFLRKMWVPLLWGRIPPKPPTPPMCQWLDQQHALMFVFTRLRPETARDHKPFYTYVIICLCTCVSMYVCMRLVHVYIYI